MHAARRWRATRPGSRRSTAEAPPFDRWQTAKGLVVALALVAVFLFTAWPRDVAALAGAGVLLLSRRMHSRDMLGLVDWQLLVLFMGLFVVNHALQPTGLLAQALAGAGGAGRATCSEPGAGCSAPRVVLSQPGLQRAGGDAAAAGGAAHPHGRSRCWRWSAPWPATC